MIVALEPEYLCERCRCERWEELYSPDGLCGHELLLCRDCYLDIEDDEDDDV